MRKTLISLVLYASFGAAGCGGSHAYEAGHVHEAKHGGVLIVCEEHVANVELVADTTDGELVFYLYDGHVENPVRSALKVLEVDVRAGEETLHLRAAAQANPLTGESVGDSSQYVVQDARLQGVESFTGTLKAVEIRGTTYTDVAFAYPADDDHDDDHDE
jgi:hypothetical protein